MVAMEGKLLLWKSLVDTQGIHDPFPFLGEANLGFSAIM
jgi:hypothetical protein